MGAHKLSVVHEGESHIVEYESDEGEEVLKYQLFSVTNILPEDQNLSQLSEFVSGLHTLTLVEGQNGAYTLKPIGGSREPLPALHSPPVCLQSDEDLARALQAEEDAIFAQQQRQVQSPHGRAEFEGKLESYVNQVMQYEDVNRQNAAQNSVPMDELEEKALVALAKEGKMSISDPEKEYAILLQLLFWFKKSFKWVDVPDCDVCGSKSDRVGMGSPTPEELLYGGARVELFRCRSCKKEIRFPRYNDPMKLLETRSGRCGEWANCFTLYCRSLGYEARLVLDFTDHVWTECFSILHNRWIHLDPCEATYDKPSLYEEGWNKKLSYVIALSNDGVFDVTKRYTRKWNEVLTRRTEVSESVVQDVIFALTARIRSLRSPSDLEKLRIRDRQEIEEISASVHSPSTQSSLPGRQSGSTDWRRLRGEIGVSQDPSNLDTFEKNPVRVCVDEHVKEIIMACGSLLKSTEASRVVKLWGRVLQKLKSQPYKSRKELFGRSAWLKDECALPLLQALGLRRDLQETGQVLIQLAGDPVKTALTLPVAIEQLEDLNQELEMKGDLKRFLKWRRLSGSTACASGEELPHEIASVAFDGLQTTKWHEPKGATGGWIEYSLAEGAVEALIGYQITSANDSPERDPLTWEVEGSIDGGQTWRSLDSQRGQLFENRYMKKCYEIGAEKSFHCSLLRFRCVSVRDPLSQPRLQLASIDYFTARDA